MSHFSFQRTADDTHVPILYLPIKGLEKYIMCFRFQTNLYALKT